MIRVLGLTLLLSGCVSAPVAPDLKIPEKVDFQMAEPTPSSCPKLNLRPVPQKALLDIQGDKIVYDEGGELILRGYVACRAALK